MTAAQRRTQRWGAGGFTLVELLIALGVVATLLGLLAPALAAARKAARAAACLSNIRQVNTASLLYAQEHRGRAMPGAADFLRNLDRWHGRRDRTGEAFDPARGPITPYLGAAGSSAAIRVCPSFARTLEALAQRGLGFERAAGGYGYNNAFLGVVRKAGPGGTWLLATDEHGSQLDRFRQPSRTIAFADAAFASDRGVEGLIEYSFVEPRFWPDAPGFRPDPATHFRHQGRANVAWLDGSASAQTRGLAVPGWFSRVDAGSVGLGWAGRAQDDDNRLYDYD